MIRAAAALKLANDLFESYIERELCSELMVQLAASLIQKHVETDELAQEIERIDAAKAALNAPLPGDG